MKGITNCEVAVSVFVSFWCTVGRNVDVFVDLVRNDVGILLVSIIYKLIVYLVKIGRIDLIKLSRVLSKIINLW